VKTEGIRTDRYTGLFLWNHTRATSGNEDDILPIGKINGLRKEGQDMLIDDPEFDESDEFAMKLKRKYEKGYVSAFSIGIVPLKFSDDPADLKPGQTRATVTECELIEISLTDIPANKEAVKLYQRNDQGELIELSDNAVPSLPPPTAQNQNDNMNLTEITAALNLSEAAQPAAVVAEINRLKAEAAKVAALSARVAQLEQLQAEAQKANVDALLSDAVKAGKITEAQRPHFAALADANFESTKAILDGLQPAVKLHQFVNADSGAGKATYNGKTFGQLSKEDPAALEALKASNYELFCSLYRSEYGKEYRATQR
jgi:hypothetical protein